MSSIRGTKNNNAPTLAVIGGGLAGITAAEAAHRSGFRVTLFERSTVLGGRVASMFEPCSGQWIDNGQHLAMGCCSELLKLHRRLDLSRFFDRGDSIPFARTGGRRWSLSAFRLFPRAWQLLPAFLGNPFLSFSDRIRLGLTLRNLTRPSKRDKPDRHRFIDWLMEQKNSEAVTEFFWKPLILSSLSETPENVGCEAVRKVVVDGFLAGREAMSVRIPTAPLRSIYHTAVEKRLRETGIELQFSARLRKIHWVFDGEKDENAAPPKTTALEFADGTRRSFDAYILAVPAFRLWQILEASDLEAYAEQLGLDRFEPGAITTVHFWLDRRLLPEDVHHTALLGGPGQFLCCPKREHDSVPSKIGGVYHTVVISASHRLLADGELTARGSGAVADRVFEQLCRTFPAKEGSASQPRRLHHRVTTYFDAVFSPSASLFSDRPEQKTPFSNLALAGDWTQTFWPATMEGAVRSGLRAVEAIAPSR